MVDSHTMDFLSKFNITQPVFPVSAVTDTPELDNDYYVKLADRLKQVETNFFSDLKSKAAENNGDNMYNKLFGSKVNGDDPWTSDIFKPKPANFDYKPSYGSGGLYDYNKNESPKPIDHYNFNNYNSDFDNTTAKSVSYSHKYNRDINGLTFPSFMIGVVLVVIIAAYLIYKNRNRCGSRSGAIYSGESMIYLIVKFIGSRLVGCDTKDW